MIRRLCQKPFTLQSQVVFFYQPKERVFQSKSFSNFTTLFIVPVQRSQQLNYSKNGCDTKLSGKNKSDCNDEVSPIVTELQKRLQCTKPEAAEVYEQLSTNGDGFKLDTTNRTLKFLSRIGASMPVIVKNCQILLVSLGKSFEKYIISFFFLDVNSLCFLLIEQIA